MNKYFIIPLFYFSISCSLGSKNSEYKNQQFKRGQVKTVYPSTESKPQRKSNQTDSKYSYIKALKGKYPTDVNLFESGVVKTQLLNLLGEENYNLFIQNMGVQVPIEIIDNEYAFVFGGAPHSFGSEEACIEIDFVNGILSVGILSEGLGVIYFTEKEDKSITKGKLNDWLKEVKNKSNN